MLTVPADLTAYQGFDALFHSTEGYINKTANIMSDMYALKAIELIGEQLSNAVHNGKDEVAREKVALGNTLAGMVESTSGCISEHSLEHALSAYHPSLPHGAGLIMISKAYYTHFAKRGCCDERMIDMAKALGKKDATTPMDFVEALTNLQEACKVADLKMSDYGIKKEELQKYVTKAYETMRGLFEVDPAPLTGADCYAILEESYR
jgi:alcohol dehydrogenase